MWQITFDVTGFSGFVVQTSPNPLPVTLLSFGARLSGDHVRVSWKTSLDHDHFELERSTDGRHFTTVVSINPMTGTGNKNYDYTDAGASLLNTSKIYYRLKMISISGAVEYSNIITVYLTPSSTHVTRVGPNPFHQKLEVGLNMPESSKLAIKLTDVYGRVVVKENLQAPKWLSVTTIRNWFYQE